MMGPIIELISHRRLVWRMTARDFKSKYAGSLMGVFWTVVNPLLLLLVFTFIFTVVFKARFGGRDEIGVSAIYILCGILPWLAFQDGVARAGTVILENKNLVTRAMFPLSALPAFPVLSAMLGQLAGLLILGFLAGAVVHAPGPSLVLLPALLALQLVFTAGLAMMISAVSVYVRDVIHVLPVLLLVWFYGTPVFYPAELVPERFGLLIRLNPMAHFIGAFRRVLLEGAWPAAGSLAAIAACSVAALIAGSLVYNKLSGGFADRL
jgi:ABC-type polysaccharide/polyol phosphate export permease